MTETLNRPDRLGSSERFSIQQREGIQARLLLFNTYAGRALDAGRDVPPPSEEAIDQASRADRMPYSAIQHSSIRERSQEWDQVNQREAQPLTYDQQMSMWRQNILRNAQQQGRAEFLQQYFQLPTLDENAMQTLYDRFVFEPGTNGNPGRERSPEELVNYCIQTIPENELETQMNHVFWLARQLHGKRFNGEIVAQIVYLRNNARTPEGLQENETLLENTARYAPDQLNQRERELLAQLAQQSVSEAQPARDDDEKPEPSQQTVEELVEQLPAEVKNTLESLKQKRDQAQKHGQEVKRLLGKLTQPGISVPETQIALQTARNELQQLEQLRNEVRVIPAITADQIRQMPEAVGLPDGSADRVAAEMQTVRDEIRDLYNQLNAELAAAEQQHQQQESPDVLKQGLQFKDRAFKVRVNNIRAQLSTMDEATFQQTVENLNADLRNLRQIQYDASTLGIPASNELYAERDRIAREWQAQIQQLEQDYTDENQVKNEDVAPEKIEEELEYMEEAVKQKMKDLREKIRACYTSEDFSYIQGPYEQDLDDVNYAINEIDEYQLPDTLNSRQEQDLFTLIQDTVNALEHQLGDVEQEGAFAVATANEYAKIQAQNQEVEEQIRACTKAILAKDFDQAQELEETISDYFFIGESTYLSRTGSFGTQGAQLLHQLYTRYRNDLRSYRQTLRDQIDRSGDMDEIEQLAAYLAGNPPAEEPPEAEPAELSAPPAAATSEPEPAPPAGPSAPSEEIDTTYSLQEGREAIQKRVEVLRGILTSIQESYGRKDYDSVTAFIQSFERNLRSDLVGLPSMKTDQFILASADAPILLMEIDLAITDGEQMYAEILRNYTMPLETAGASELGAGRENDQDAFFSIDTGFHFGTTIDGDIITVDSYPALFKGVALAPLEKEQSIKKKLKSLETLKKYKEQLGHPFHGLQILADGAGGHGHGEFASAAVMVEIVDEIALRLKGNQDLTEVDLAEAMERAHSYISLFLPDGVTTCTVVLEYGNTVFTGSTGDSRVYITTPNREEGAPDGSLLNGIDIPPFSVADTDGRFHWNTTSVFSDQSTVWRLLLARDDWKPSSILTSKIKNQIYRHLGGMNPPEIQTRALRNLPEGSIIIQACDGVWEDVQVQNNQILEETDRIFEQLILDAIELYQKDHNGADPGGDDIIKIREDAARKAFGYLLEQDQMARINLETDSPGRIVRHLLTNSGQLSKDNATALVTRIKPRGTPQQPS